jgi:hypothetical protein
MNGYTAYKVQPSVSVFHVQNYSFDFDKRKSIGGGSYIKNCQADLISVHISLVIPVLKMKLKHWFMA